MCTRCRLATPRGAQELCPSCAIDLRVDVRRGLEDIDAYLGGWAEFERWLEERRR
ncbi:MAG TPA: hypothetical protein VFN93_05185 [Gaiellaceae bacterium]|nr:hypothetical protein [Gaiellaceae bacterium]